LCGTNNSFVGEFRVDHVGLMYKRVL